MDNLQKQIDEIKSDQIATLSSQVASISLSIGNLQTVDNELRGYITTLQEQKVALEKADQDLTKSIADLKTELSGDISAAEANALSQLETYKSTVTSQLESINSALTALQGKDEDLQQQITTLKDYVENDLKAYIDNGDNGVKTWVSATFVTLEQFNTTAGIISTIQGQIASINQQIEQMSGAASGISQSELDAAISTLDTSLSEKISQAVSDWDSALSTARDEITAAYTTAIQSAISSSESSMRTWVNNQLSGYYTIAQTDAKLSSLKTNLEGQLSTQKTQLQTIISNLEATLELKIKNNADDIEEIRGLIATCNTLIEQNAQAISDNAAAITQLRTDLGTARTEITAAYQQAISTAITTLDGQLRGKIATEVETINARIDDEVTAINATIEALSARVTQCEKDIRNIKNAIYSMQQDIEDLQEQVAAILARIQSISFVPAYSDGKVPVNYTDNGTLTPGTATLDFKLQPASTAAELAQVWQNALKVEAVYTITKAPEAVQLTITSVTAENGYLTVTVSGAALKEDFFRSRCSANATLTISDGNNELASEYVPLVPWTTDVISFGDPLFKAYCVENFDTDQDGEITEDEAKAVTAINASMLNITSLVGIEYFSKLESIDVSFNKLETLDLSHSPKLETVLVNGNKLQSLGLDGLAAMTALDCSNNKLTALNVSEAEGLLNLNCSNNNIGALNLKKNKALVELQCSGNQLTALDLKNNTALVEVYCKKNEIKTIDINKLAALTHLDCSNNGLTSLDVDTNISLEVLYCYSNALTSLRLGSKPLLTILDCSQNALTALNVFGCAHVENLNCSSNVLGNIDVSTLVNMTILSCENNNIASLDVSGLAALKTLKCTSENLKKLWVKDAAQQAALNITKHNNTAIFFNNGGIYIPDAKLKAYLVNNFDENADGEISPAEADLITSVNCSGKSIADLTGIEACTNLTYLNCSGNSLTKLDLHTLTNLQTLVCHGNKLADINLDNCSSLTTFNIIDATTNAYGLNSNGKPQIGIKNYTQAATLKFSMDVIKGRIWVYASPTLTSVDLSDNSCTEIVVNENINMTSVKVPASLVNYYGYSCALKQIDFSNCQNLEYIQIYSNRLTSLDVSHNPKLHTIQAYDNQLSSLDITNNPKMRILMMADNKLTAINLLGNINLEQIDLGNNRLSSINVRTLDKLTVLSVSNNTAITDVNVSNNTALKTLNVYKTAISTLDVSHNTALTSLVAKSTPITVLDVSANPALKSLNVASTSISSLDVSNNTSLATLDVSNNTSLATLEYNGCTINASGLKIGTYVNVASKKGVVFFSSGVTVKIVSADEASKAWGGDYGISTFARSTTDGVANTNKIPNSSAVEWCRAKGSAWYLPAIEELKEVYNKKSTIDTTLSSIGGTRFGTGYYWSSTEDNVNGALCVNFTSGSTSSDNKYSSYSVRAVRAL